MKRIWLVVSVFVIFCVIVVVALQFKQSTMQAVVREMHEAGLPTNKAELAALGPQKGADAASFYDLYQEGADKYAAQPGHENDFRNLYVMGIAQADQDKLVLRMRNLLSPTIEGAKCERWVMDPESGQRMMDGLSGLQLLCLVAEADARLGKFDQAIDEIRLADKIAVQVWKNPSMSRMWEGLYREEDRVLRSFHRCMEAAKNNPLALKHGEEFLKSLPPQPSVYFGLKCDTAETGFDDWLNMSTTDLWHDEDAPVTDIDKLKDKFWYAPKIHREQARYARLRLRILKDIPQDATWDVASAIHERDWTAEEKRNGVFEYFDFEVVVEGSLDMWAEDLTRRRVELMALRIQEQRLRVGALPKKLPDFGADGIDPFTGKCLIYRPEGTGFIVYGVNRNRTDDGGSPIHVADMVAAYE